MEAPAQYGERLRAAAVYLHPRQSIPEERTAEALADVFGVPSIAPASVMDWVRRKASALGPVAGRIGALVAAARVRCLDETGFRVAGKTRWLHTVATESLTLYRVSDRRGDVPNTLAGGVVVHDRFKSYGALEAASHALCNAHHSRELKAPIEFDKEPWAAPMRDLLLDGNRAVGDAKARGERALDAALLVRFDTRFWNVLREGLAFHRKLPRLPQAAAGKIKRRPGENLLRRRHQFKDDVPRFLVDFEVPFTNNLAEQELRMMKAKMKTSGLPNFRRRSRLRGAPLRHRYRKKTRMEHPPHPQPRRSLRGSSDQNAWVSRKPKVRLTNLSARRRGEATPAQT